MEKNNQVSPEKAVIAFLRSIQRKNPAEFEACFDLEENLPFLDVLPGGMLVDNTRQLITMHEGFFADSETSFEPQNESKEFTEKHLIQPVLKEPFFLCGIRVRVVKIKAFGESDKDRTLITIHSHLSLTFHYDEKKGKWFPIHIANTIIDD